MTQAQKEAEIAEAEKSTDWWDIQPSNKSKKD
jgi:hypothetical protein